MGFFTTTEQDVAKHVVDAYKMAFDKSLIIKMMAIMVEKQGDDVGAALLARCADQLQAHHNRIGINKKKTWLDKLDDGEGLFG